MNNYDKCPICFNINFENYASKLKCGHILCSHCLIYHTLSAYQTRKQKIECPMCRYVILDIDNVYENDNENIDSENNNENIIDNGNNNITHICIFLFLLFVIVLLFISIVELLYQYIYEIY